MAGRGNPSGTVDVRTNVALVGHERRSRMQADPHRDRTRCQRVTNRLSRFDRCRRRREGDKESVSLGVHLGTAETCASLAYQAAMPGERLRVSLRTELLEQPCRALDVGGEKGDGSRRKVASHRRMMRQDKLNVRGERL